MSQLQQAVDAFHRDLKRSLKQAAVPMDDMTSRSAQVHGDEVQSPLMYNPYKLMDPEAATDYENGYEYAQSIGHQGLMQANPEQWMSNPVPWREGFALAAKRLGAKTLSDNLTPDTGMAGESKSAMWATEYLEMKTAASLGRNVGRVLALPVTGPVAPMSNMLGARLGRSAAIDEGPVTADERFAMQDSGSVGQGFGSTAAGGLAGGLAGGALGTLGGALLGDVAGIDTSTPEGELAAGLGMSGGSAIGAGLGSTLGAGAAGHHYGKKTALEARDAMRHAMRG